MVSEEDAWNFCFVLPSADSHAPKQIVVPTALQMGWCESPAYFCSATETACDIIDWLLYCLVPLPPHPLEQQLLPSIPLHRKQGQQNRAWIGVYMDDFLLAATSNKTSEYFICITHAGLSGIHFIFPPIIITGHQDGKEPISVPKLECGDAKFATTKIILGFLFDGINKTTQLLPEKALSIICTTQKMLKKKTCSLKTFQKVTSKLQHGALILPSAKELFTPVNEALKNNPKVIGLGQKSEVRLNLLDLLVLIHSLAMHHTHILEIAPGPADFIGFCDASTAGAWGVWFALLGGVFTPKVW